ncbi:MAG: transposase [Serratia symbiotica]|nr:transposase [Serratia symbiotica]
MAVDTETHEVICTKLSLSNVTNTEAFPGLIRQTYRKIKVTSADGAFDTLVSHDELRRKKIRALIPPRSGARYWSADYADLNQAVANQRLTGDNTRRESMTGYHRRLIAETAMYRVK